MYLHSLVFILLSDFNLDAIFGFVLLQIQYLSTCPTLFYLLPPSQVFHVEIVPLTLIRYCPDPVGYLSTTKPL